MNSQISQFIQRYCSMLVRQALREDLRSRLQSLSLENQKDAPKYEIIVTDDSRSDRCRKVVELEFPNASWKVEKMKGPGQSQPGAARAMGEWIIFIDDDCIAQSSIYRLTTKPLIKNPSIGVLEGRIFPIGKGDMGRSMPCQ